MDIRNLSQWHLQVAARLLVCDDQIDVMTEIKARNVIAQERNKIARDKKTSELLAQKEQRVTQMQKKVEMKNLRLITGVRSPRVLEQLVTLKTSGYTHKIRGVFPNGKSKASDLTSEVKRGLCALGLKFNTGNDAPRGGECGWFAQVVA